MQLFTLFSYIMDGFAYAGEALAGRFIGAKTMWGYVNAFAYCSYGESASHCLSRSFMRWEGRIFWDY